MGKDIDWSKAPEWAKWHGFNAFRQAAWIGEKNYQYVDDVGSVWEFGSTGYELKSFQDLTARSVVWSGEGLPPVGAVCEFHDPRAVIEWRECRVIAHDNALAIVNYKGNYFVLPHNRLRPIRTPEQIAAEERLKAIDEMAAVYKSNPSAILALIAESEALRKDAERYRWLRSQPTCYMHSEGWQIRHHWRTQDAMDTGRPHGLHTVCLSKESLDVTIDTAMTKELANG